MSTARYQVPGVRGQMPGARLQVSGSRCQGLGKLKLNFYKFLLRHISAITTFTSETLPATQNTIDDTHFFSQNMSLKQRPYSAIISFLRSFLRPTNLCFFIKTSNYQKIKEYVSKQVYILDAVSLLSFYFSQLKRAKWLVLINTLVDK